MVSALSQRWTIQHKAHAHDKELNISLIFTSCFSQNYVRSIAEELGKRQIPLPRLMITGTEYGQYGWTAWESSYGMQFNELLISFPTVGEILQNKRSATHSTPSIFVPRKEDPKKLMQLGGIVVPSPNTEVG